MEKNFTFDEELFNDELDELDELEEELSGEQGSYLRDINFYLTEDDFYSSSDDRVWTSNIEDIDGGDNFADYCKYIFKLLNEEGYYDN